MLENVVIVFKNILMQIDWIIFSNIVMASATFALAVFAFQSNKLAKEIKRANDLKEKGDLEHKQQTSDLYEAIVISTMITGPSGTSNITATINSFKSLYKGKTKIFNE